MKTLTRGDVEKITTELEKMARAYYKEPENPFRKKLDKMLRSFKIFKKDYILQYLSQDHREKRVRRGKRQKTEILIAVGIEIHTEPKPTSIGVSVKIKGT